MKQVKELELQNARWVQTRWWKEDYELRSPEGELLATMTRPHWWNSYTEIEAPGNRWSLERKGLFRRRIEIRSIGAESSPAEFIYQWVGGRLELPDGRVFFWKPGNFWGTRYVWTTADGEPIIGYKAGGGLEVSGEMSVAPAAADMPLFGLLMFLGWYLAVLNREDMVTAAALGS
jgi:hypothetical protein